MQKHITIDMLSHKVVKNKDIAQKYYIKDHHAPIIRREMWEQVQALLNKNSINAPQTKKGIDLPFCQIFTVEFAGSLTAAITTRQRF